MPSRAPPRQCPGCGVPIRRTMLACAIHWKSLPKETRSKVSKAWKERLAAERARAEHPDDPQIVQADRAAMHAHMGAVREALTQIRQQVDAPPPGVVFKPDN